MSGSDVDRRTSYGSTARSTTHHEVGAIDERSEDGSHYDQSDVEDDDPTTTITNIDAVAPSEITASELSTATGDMPLPTESEVDRAVEAVKQEMAKEAVYAPPSDSGVGTDLATAEISNESEVDADYFRRAAEEESVVG
jgi:hypothetical protein